MRLSKLSLRALTRVLLVISFSIFGNTAFGINSESLVQEILAEQGYYSGSIDGQFGSKSKEALISFCREKKLDCPQDSMSNTLDFLHRHGFNANNLYQVPVFEKFNFDVKDPDILL